MTDSNHSALQGIVIMRRWLKQMFPLAVAPAGVVQHFNAGGLIRLCDIAIEKERCGVPRDMLPKLLYLLEQGYQVGGVPHPSHRLAWPRERTERFLQDCGFSEPMVYDLMENIRPPEFLGN